MADNKVTVQIEVEGNARVALNQTAKALDNVEKEAKQAGKSFLDFGRIADVALGNVLANVASRGFDVLTQSAKNLFNTLIVDGVKAAQVQEDAIANLNAALKRSGEFSEEASQEIQDFASALQKTTVVGDETTLELFALGKAFGFTKDTAKVATEAAIELAAAAGIQLEEAMRRVGRTVSGSIEDVSKFAPAIKELSKEQLAAGDAALILRDALAGTAAAQAATFSGALKQTENAIGDFTEEIGFAITNNEALIAVFKTVSEFAIQFTEGLKGDTKGLQDFVTDGVLFAIDALKLFAAVAQTVTLTTLKLSAGVIKAQGVLSAFTAALGSKEAGERAEKSAEEFLKLTNAINSLEGSGSVFVQVNDKLEQLRQTAIKAAKSQGDIGTAAEDSANRALTATKALTTAQKALISKGVSLVKSVEDSDFKENLDAQLEAIDAAIEAGKVKFEEGELAKEEIALQFQEKQDARVAKELEDIEKLALAALDADIAELERLTALNELLIEADAELNRALVDSNKNRIDTIITDNADSLKLQQKLEKDTLTEKINSDKRALAAEKQLNKDRREVIAVTASFQSSKIKEVAAIGKAAAVANTLIATFEGAQKAFNALAGIPIVGPILGTAAAAAAIGAGIARVAKITGVELQTGITEVPPGFPNDTFSARLSSGERVVSAQQNQDLTQFLQQNDLLSERLDALIAVVSGQQQQTIVNIGGDTIVDTLQDQLDSGRNLSV